MTLVAVSAAYGAAGSRIGPALAERLGVPFVDRAIALAVAERLDVPVQDAVQAERGTGGGWLTRALATFAAADDSTPMPVAADAATDADFHVAARQAVLEQAAAGEGVILGRGAVAALREDARVLRVRLTGPVQARLAQAMALGAVDERTAEQALHDLDRAHAEYMRRFYDIDIEDPRLYHLVVDSTALATDTVVEVVAVAAAGRREPALRP